MQAWLQGGVTTTAITVLGLAASAGLEAFLQRRGVGWYHRLGFALPDDLGALRRAPKGRGRGYGVAWAVADGQEVRFHAAGTGAPRGMHGTARLRRDQLGRVHLDLVWAPAWTPLLALLWLAVLSGAQGEALPVGAVAAVLMAALLLAHAQVAPRVGAALAASLREAEEREDA